MIDLSSTFFNTSYGTYSIPKKSTYTEVFLSINDEKEYVTLLCLSSRSMTYTPSFILGKLSLEKTPLNVAL